MYAVLIPAYPSATASLIQTNHYTEPILSDSGAQARFTQAASKQ